MRFNEHNINDLDYIKNLKNDTYAVAYLNETKDKYIDMRSCTTVTNHRERIYRVENTKKICDFKKIVSMDKLWLLLLDSNGNVRENLILPQVELVLMTFNNLSIVNRGLRREFNVIATKVSKLCLENLNIKNRDLEKLLKSYILIELVNNYDSNKLSIINKMGSCIDYKIQRLLKYLNIDINIKDVPNFRIEYDLYKIKYCNEKGNITEYQCLSEKEKVKKLI